MDKRRVVITGLGCVSPLGLTVDALQKGFEESRNGIGPITRFDTEGFATKIAGEVKDFDPLKWVEKRETRQMDRFILLAIAAAQEAMDASGLEITNELALRVGTILGIGVSISGLVVPEYLRLPIHMLGQVSIPLLLFSLGVRMISIDLKDWRIGSVAALVCPLSGLAIGIPLVQLLPLPGEQASILLLFAALPPAVINFLVAERFNQEPQKVASIVLIANFASILVIPAVLWAIL